MKWENVYKSLFLSLLLLFGCSAQHKEIEKKEETVKKEDTTQTSPLQIELIVQEESIEITLQENETTKNLLNVLPLEVRIGDFANAEKIMYLDTALEESIPKGYDPQVYDFAYYAPWHNLVLFYKDQPYDEGLIPLGKITSGQNAIQNITEDTIIKLQKKKR